MPAPAKLSAVLPTSGLGRTITGVATVFLIHGLPKGKRTLHSTLNGNERCGNAIALANQTLQSVCSALFAFAQFGMRILHVYF